MNFNPILENKSITVSVPCRIDFGGTLDISTFYLSLRTRMPSSINMALDLRTHVTLSAFDQGKVKVSSRGFEPAVFARGCAPFDHPMGLMFCVANYFGAHGVHIRIESTSPPKSALGGSSSAAVAIIAAFYHALKKTIDPQTIAWLAHYLEASVAGVPCGMQDQLAAAFGGVNQWIWKMGDNAPEFEQIKLFDTQKQVDQLNDHLLVAYCGIPHVSKDINGRWVRSFVQGKSREAFEKIAGITQAFVQALKAENYQLAADLMIQETLIRLGLTPDVLDQTGLLLFDAARSCHCGARFTGAGGGGCIWAIGTDNDIEKLRPIWHNTLKSIENAKILNTKIENKGIIID